MKIHTPSFIIKESRIPPMAGVTTGTAPWHHCSNCRSHRCHLTKLQVHCKKAACPPPARHLHDVTIGCHVLFFSISMPDTSLRGGADLERGFNTVAAATCSDALAGRKGGCASSGREHCSEGPVSKDREQRCWRRWRRDQSITLARYSAAASGRRRRAGMLSIHAARQPTDMCFASLYLG